MKSTSFNLLDDSFLNIERSGEPWNIHLELHFEGRIDRDRLEAAIHHAGKRHPMARARIAAFNATTTQFRWELPDEFDHLPLSVLHVQDEAAWQDQRDRLVSVQPPPSLSPGFLIYLIKGPDADALLIMLNHVVADGLSSFRIMNSIMRHYAGEDDPVPPFDPLDQRNLKTLAGSRSLKQAAERLGVLAHHVLRSAGAPARIRPQRDQAQDAADGYGCVLLRFDADETAQIMAQRQKPATINDMLIAAMLRSFQQWNHKNQTKAQRISTMMPVNIRPKDWWFEVVGNYSSYVAVSLNESALVDLPTATRAVYEQTGTLKEAGASGVLIDLLDIPKFLPSVLKARLKDITPTLGGNLVESTWVSNLGRLGEAPSMGDAGKVTALYFSPPAPLSMGLTLGIASIGQEMFLSFRYRRSVLDRQAAERFAASFKNELLGQ